MCPFVTKQNKQLEDFGTALSSFKHIRLFDASRNALTSAAPVQSLTSALVLNLQENKLSALPDVASLKHLQVLNANTNAISSVAGLASTSLIQVSVNGTFVRGAVAPGTSIPVSSANILVCALCCHSE